MRMQSLALRASFCRSLLTNTIKLRNKPARSLVLLGLIAVATTALASTVSSAGSVRQLIMDLSAAERSVSEPAQSKAAVNNLLLTPAPDASTTMTVERLGHTATLLADGRVLIVGGENSGGVIGQSEVFDPAAGTFSVGGNLGSARADHSATRLADGRVLIAGGRGAAGALTATEIFDPTTGAFSTGPAMSVARAGHSATLFADGRVFIAGGDANGSAEIFDPSSSSFSAVAANMNTARSMHSAALLADGRVLLVGGRTPTGDTLSSGEIFDTPAATFSTVDSALKVARVHAHLRVLFDGKVQIIGGSNDGSMEIYDPLIEEFGAYAHVLPESDTCAGLPAQVLASQTRAALFHNGQSDPLFDRTGHTITELNGQALVLGGANSSGAVLNSSSVVASSSASITTDKMDYAPGETVAITGRGFQAGETVRVKIHEDPHTPQERGFDAVADADGNFSGEYIVQDYDLDMKFMVGARGLTSGAVAQTAFTDARTINSVTLNGGSSVSVAPGASITAVVNVTTDGSGANSRWRSTGWRISATPPTVLGDVTVVDHPNHDSAATFNETFSITAPTTAGTYNAYFIAYNDDSGGGQPSATFTLSASVTVNPGTLSAFAVTNTSDGNIGTQTAGTPFNIKVRAVDTFNNTVTSFNGGGNRVVISSTGTLSAGSGVSASFVNGVLASHSVTISNTGSFTITATRNSGGSEFGTSNSFTVNAPACTSPSVTTNPTNQNVTYGAASVSLTAAASGTPAPTIQWQVSTGGPFTNLSNTPPYSGVTTGTLLISSPTVSLSGNQYRAVFTNSCVPATATSTAATLTVNKANATVVVTPYSVTYDGNPHTAAVTSITGVNGETGATVGTVDVSNTTHTNAGTYAADYWFFTGTANYNNIGNTTITDTINKANANCSSVVGFTGTYDAAAHGATGSCIGVASETLSGLNLGASFTNVPGGTANWVFTDVTGNYNDTNGSVAIVINQAVADCSSIVGYSGTYDAAAHGASGVCTGVAGDPTAAGSSLNLGASFTNVPGGTANWTFTGGTNYTNQNGSVAIVINQAVADCSSIVGYSGTYDAAAHGASGVCTGVAGDPTAAGSSLNLGASFTNVPGGTANWSFTGGTNYTNQNGSVAIVINQAVADCSSIVGYSGTYDATAHGATGACTGVAGDPTAAGSSVSLGASFTNVPGGTANWTFTGGTNYTNQNGSVAIVINKANATVVVIPYSVTYDANPHTATYTVTGVGTDTAATGSSIDVSGTTHTAAGTYNGDAWSFTGGTNYNDQNGTVDDFIGKANANCSSITGYSVTYDTVSHTATGTCQGVGADGTLAGLDLSGTTHTAAGSYPTDPWTFTDVSGNYNNTSGTVADSISKRNTLTTVSSSLNPSTFGESVSYTATVVGTGAGAGNPSGGSVQFKIDSAPFGVPVAVVAGSASSGSTATLSAGPHTVEAVFTSSDTNFNGSSDPLDGGQTVNKRNTLTTVSSSLNPSIYGQSVSFSAAVVGTGAGAGNPSGGTVQFMIDNANFGAPVALVSGSATSGATTTLSVGNHIVEAIFTSSDTNFNNSSDLLDGGQTVGAWTLTGFYQPVGIPNTYNLLLPPMSGITWNSIKGGQTVPLKFNVFAGTVEQTLVSAIAGFTVQEVACVNVGTTIDDVDFVTTGTTQLRYDGTPGAGGQFIQNWQTPKTANKCYRTVMTASDSSVLVAFFMTKK